MLKARHWLAAIAVAAFLLFTVLLAIAADRAQRRCEASGGDYIVHSTGKTSWSECR